MIPASISYGDRYSDDSGWERLPQIDTHAGKVTIDIGGNHLLSCTHDDLWWLIRAALSAREQLGYDKLEPAAGTPIALEMKW